MPYFYKLSDYFNIETREQWMNAVLFTIADFILTCDDKETIQGNKGIQILTFNMKNTNIYKHTINFEYITYEDISEDKIIGISSKFTKKNVIKSDVFIKGTYSLNYDGENKLHEYIDYIYETNQYISHDIMNYLYIHITCSDYVNAIITNGLLYDSGNKVGDYDSDAEQDAKQDDEQYSKQDNEQYDEQDNEQDIEQYFEQYLEQDNEQDSKQNNKQYDEQNDEQDIEQYFKQYLEKDNDQDSKQNNEQYDEIDNINRGKKRNMYGEIINNGETDNQFSYTPELNNSSFSSIYENPSKLQKNEDSLEEYFDVFDFNSGGKKKSYKNNKKLKKNKFTLKKKNKKNKNKYSKKIIKKNKNKNKNKYSKKNN
jgi:hypothetical protein